MGPERPIGTEVSFEIRDMDFSHQGWPADVMSKNRFYITVRHSWLREDLG